MSGTQIKKIEENRKIQVTGGSTFILSLPKKWVQKNQIKKGDSVFVREEENGSLSIDTLGDGKLEKKRRDLNKNSSNRQYIFHFKKNSFNIFDRIY